jgi:hypothetical protein
MVMVELSEQTVAQLTRIAQEHQQSLDEAVVSLLKNVPTPEVPEVSHDENIPRPGTMGALIKAAREANIRGKESNVAERSREILNKEFPEYLWRRMQESVQEEEARTKQPSSDQE